MTDEEEGRVAAESGAASSSSSSSSSPSTTTSSRAASGSIIMSNNTGHHHHHPLPQQQSLQRQLPTTATTNHKQQQYLPYTSRFPSWMTMMTRSKSLSSHPSATTNPSATPSGGGTSTISMSNPQQMNPSPTSSHKKATGKHHHHHTTATPPPPPRLLGNDRSGSQGDGQSLYSSNTSKGMTMDNINQPVRRSLSDLQVNSSTLLQQQQQQHRPSSINTTTTTTTSTPPPPRRNYFKLFSSSSKNETTTVTTISGSDRVTSDFVVERSANQQLQRRSLPPQLSSSSLSSPRQQLSSSLTTVSSSKSSASSSTTTATTATASTNTTTSDEDDDPEAEARARAVLVKNTLHNSHIGRVQLVDIENGKFLPSPSPLPLFIDHYPPSQQQQQQPSTATTHDSSPLSISDRLNSTSSLSSIPLSSNTSSILPASPVPSASAVTSAAAGGTSTPDASLSEEQRVAALLLRYALEADRMDGIRRPSAAKAAAAAAHAAHAVAVDSARSQKSHDHPPVGAQQQQTAPSSASSSPAIHHHHHQRQTDSPSATTATSPTTPTMPIPPANSPQMIVTAAAASLTWSRTSERETPTTLDETSVSSEVSVAPPAGPAVILPVQRRHGSDHPAIFSLDGVGIAPASAVPPTLQILSSIPSNPSSSSASSSPSVANLPIIDPASQSTSHALAPRWSTLEQFRADHEELVEKLEHLALRKKTNSSVTPSGRQRSSATEAAGGGGGEGSNGEVAQESGGAFAEQSPAITDEGAMDSSANRPDEDYVLDEEEEEYYYENLEEEESEMGFSSTRTGGMNSGGDSYTSPGSDRGSMMDGGGSSSSSLLQQQQWLQKLARYSPQRLGENHPLNGSSLPASELLLWRIGNNRATSRSPALVTSKSKDNQSPAPRPPWAAALTHNPTASPRPLPAPTLLNHHGQAPLPSGGRNKMMNWPPSSWSSDNAYPGLHLKRTMTEPSGGMLMEDGSSAFASDEGDGNSVRRTISAELRLIHPLAHPMSNGSVLTASLEDGGHTALAGGEDNATVSSLSSSNRLHSPGVRQNSPGVISFDNSLSGSPSYFNSALHATPTLTFPTLGSDHNSFMGADEYPGSSNSAAAAGGLQQRSMSAGPLSSGHSKRSSLTGRDLAALESSPRGGGGGRDDAGIVSGLRLSGVDDVQRIMPSGLGSDWRQRPALTRPTSLMRDYDGLGSELNNSGGILHSSHRGQSAMSFASSSTPVPAFVPAALYTGTPPPALAASWNAMQQMDLAGYGGFTAGGGGSSSMSNGDSRKNAGSIFNSGFSSSSSTLPPPPPPPARVLWADQGGKNLEVHHAFNDYVERVTALRERRLQELMLRRRDEEEREARVVREAARKSRSREVGKEGGGKDEKVVVAAGGASSNAAGGSTAGSSTPRTFFDLFPTVTVPYAFG